MGPSMNRNLWVLGLLSLVGVSMSASDASAFLLRHHFRHHRFVTQITCRPYNAFTPICWGNLVCDGCTPNPCAVAGGCMPMGCGPTGCAPWNNGGSVQQFMPSDSCTTLPTTTGMAYPAPQAMPNYTAMQYYNHYYPTPAPVQNVGYQGYYPGYQYPAGYNNYPVNYNYQANYGQQSWQPNPYYWYNTGR